MQKKVEKLSKNIKKLRIENELSMSQMAKRLRIKMTDYEKLESGILSPAIEVEMLFFAEKEFGIESYKLLM